MTEFESTLQAALARLAAVQPEAYARTRNALGGAVTRLSPYITHGWLSLPQVYLALCKHQLLDKQHKLVSELGWRAYWHHVWHHIGDGIHQSLHAGPLPEKAYQTSLPEDVLEARTGVPAIDQAVRELYSQGYLHNHARLWLASYVVHLRKVHWHTGAQWMLGHLLDGDLASNHLSWQWVAGTGSSKPYLFNADNVARFAPPHWHSPGTVIDCSYEALDQMARSPRAVQSDAAEYFAPASAEQPALTTKPPGNDWSAPDAALVAGRDVWLIHPWSLGTMVGTEPAAKYGKAVCIGLGLAENHAHIPWSAHRWSFVTAGLKESAEALWWGNVQGVAAALQDARSVRWQSEPHADAGLRRLQLRLKESATGPTLAVTRPHSLFEVVEHRCQSYSKWWGQTRIVS
jgi:deoxyribodipyrimidine photo-lyase